MTIYPQFPHKNEGSLLLEYIHRLVRTCFDMGNSLHFSACQTTPTFLKANMMMLNVVT